MRKCPCGTSLLPKTLGVVLTANLHGRGGGFSVWSQVGHHKNLGLLPSQIGRGDLCYPGYRSECTSARIWFHWGRRAILRFWVSALGSVRPENNGSHPKSLVTRCPSLVGIPHFSARCAHSQGSGVSHTLSTSLVGICNWQDLHKSPIVGVRCGKRNATYEIVLESRWGFRLTRDFPKYDTIQRSFEGTIHHWYLHQQLSSNDHPRIPFNVFPCLHKHLTSKC